LKADEWIAHVAACEQCRVAVQGILAKPEHPHGQTTHEIKANCCAVGQPLYWSFFEPIREPVDPKQFGIGLRIHWRTSQEKTGIIESLTPEYAPNIWHVVWDKPRSWLYGSDWYKKEDLTPVA
jgi:hypothetical protein